MEIRINKPARKCCASERLFEHGEEVTSLVRLEDRVLVREDYARECWDDARGDGALAMWTTLFYDPAVAEQEPPEVFSPLRQVFYECVESEGRPDLATAYLAAQLLRRQKVFRLIKESDDLEGEVRIALFSDRIGGRLIEVRDPNLTYGEMETGRQVLMERLAELENPEPMELESDDAQQ